MTQAAIPNGTPAAPDAVRRQPERPEKLRLGDVLVQQKLISQEQLQNTLELQRTTGKKVGRLLIETGVITEELLANGRDMQQIKEFLDVDSIGYISLEGMLSCASLPKEHYCTACWSGNYPIPIQTVVNKFTMERYQMQLFEDDSVQM